MTSTLGNAEAGPPTVPDHTAPDHTAHDHTAQDPTVPDHTAPDHTAPAPKAAHLANPPIRHLLSIADLGHDGIAELLDVAEAFAEVERRTMPKVPTLRGRVVATIFFEESTRTRLSFETAAKRLSADVLSLAVGTSSVKKGESLRDTVETVEAMGIDALIVRHRSSGACRQVARWARRARVVNAGDGWHEHPTQALVDCLTLRQVWAEREGVTPESLGTACFAGKRVLIVGDILHSRVARSQVLAFAALGSSVALCAPGSLMPPSLAGWPVSVEPDLDEAIGRANVVSLLRIQQERGSGAYVPSLREYTEHWGMTARRVARLAPGAVVTHPGPMRRGVEIAGDVADLDITLATRQVANGVAVRMAVLFLLLGGPAGPGAVLSHE
ncbi:MAG: aspartate carbamoyltransferase catalytic subunit [Actinomycetota bacterium]|jgi:aspartate carbamoyltransferase catalytic subunit|nr:aspartate carbamoyltransferase catalytic subunit [Actinomycetota bacterium]